MNLFVYGTLRKGFDSPWAERLASAARFVGSGKVRGEIFLITYYSGLVLNDRGWVLGDLFELDSDSEILAALDEYEGSEQFRRVDASVLLDSGQNATSQVYVYTGGTHGKQRIESGDYVEWFHRQSPTAMKPAQ